MTFKNIKQFEKEIKEEKKRIILFNEWYENKSDELYTTKEGHKVEGDWLQAGERIPKIKAQISQIKEIVKMLGLCKEYKDVTKEMDKDGASPVISKEEIKQKLGIK
ncbi:hypothetical protein LCGC14_0556640 [marine sediment metagenome]|uniref:Uncharacterized protein n=1 Tax=marine sediment metagenome TaxID=412755 RepID=A0A0F9U9P3_9ZZZZ